jgi:hypothetical protein
MLHDLTSRFASLTLVALLAASAVQTPAQDVAPNRNEFFGAAALACGQTARVNIAQFDDPGEFPAGAVCTIIVNYFAVDGSQLISPLRGQVGGWQNRVC